MATFLMLALFPLFAIFLGFKALMPAGIELWDGKQLSQRTSKIIGVATIIGSLITVICLFGYFVLRVKIF